MTRPHSRPNSYPPLDRCPPSWHIRLVLVPLFWEPRAPSRGRPRVGRIVLRQLVFPFFFFFRSKRLSLPRDCSAWTFIGACLANRCLLGDPTAQTCAASPLQLVGPPRNLWSQLFNCALPPFFPPNVYSPPLAFFAAFSARNPPFLCITNTFLFSRHPEILGGPEWLVLFLASPACALSENSHTRLPRTLAFSMPSE